MMSKEPIALQLRFLQTMREISSEHNTTTFFPLPIDLLTSLNQEERTAQVVGKLSCRAGVETSREVAIKLCNGIFLDFAPE